MGPLVTALFSYFLIRVPVAKIDVIVLIVSFIGVAILITGTVQDPKFLDNSTPETVVISSAEGVPIE